MSVQRSANLPGSEWEVRDHAGIARRRMHTQGFWGAWDWRPEDVVRWLGAVRAEDVMQAQWSIAQRSRALTAQDVGRAFEDGRILRTHVMALCPVVVHREDLRWQLALAGLRTRARLETRLRALGIAAGTHRRAYRVFERAVRGAVQTGEHLERALQDDGITVTGESLSHLLLAAELDGVLACGPWIGGRQTYMAFDQVVPPGPVLNRDEALALLAHRYFRSRGPATVKDFAQWAHLTTADAHRGLAAIARELERVVLDDRTYWFDDRSAWDPLASPRVDLVFWQDDILSSYGESCDVVAGRKRRCRASPAPVAGVVLRDGRFAGRWRLVRRPRPEIEISLCVASDRLTERLLRSAVERFAAFLGETVSVSRLDRW